MLATAPLRQAPKKITPKIIGPADDLILHALDRFHYLTSAQICRLHYSPSSLGYVRGKLKALADAELVLTLFLPRPTQRGSAPSIFTLARKGLNYLDACGVDVDARFHPSEQREHAYLFLAHSLALSDVLIGLELFGRAYPTLEIAQVAHERALKHAPLRVDLTEDGRPQKLSLCPDAWIDLRLGADQLCLWWEVDRGTEEQRKFARKITGVIASLKGPYQKRFGTNVLSAVAFTTPDPKRLLTLLRWTETVLDHRKERHLADLFRFTCLSPATTDPTDFFLSNGWYHPFGRSAGVPLSQLTLADCQPGPLLEGIR